ncbi:SCO3242 family prenyltransferase [Streptomyces sp. NPDC059063]|uniref:SCO3242 family prenyltransferase n=1 Tax=unclassified Streptomyces TaxID=2593676 RepID=UPI00367C4160
MSSLRDWADLLRVSALCTVPGDALAGAAAGRAPLGARTALAAGASMCLYEAGMALNDWADQDQDARERPDRPLPSGRIPPAQALAAALALTGAGLGLARAAGRPAAVTATALAATVWAYDLRLKHTPAGPAAMAAARGLDLILGAAASANPAAAGGGPLRAVRRAWAPAAVLGAHTYALTALARNEARGGSSLAPLAALATTTALGATAALSTTAALGATAARGTTAAPDATPVRGAAAVRGATAVRGAAALRGTAAALGATAVRGTAAAPGAAGASRQARPARRRPQAWATAVLAGAYVATAARPYLHAALNPSPPLTQRAVGGGIRALIPLQAALAARSGALTGAALLTAVVPVARRLARTVSPT